MTKMSQKDDPEMAQGSGDGGKASQGDVVEAAPRGPTVSGDGDQVRTASPAPVTSDAVANDSGKYAGGDIKEIAAAAENDQDVKEDVSPQQSSGDAKTHSNSVTGAEERNSEIDKQEKETNNNDSAIINEDDHKKDEDVSLTINVQVKEKSAMADDTNNQIHTSAQKVEEPGDNIVAPEQHNSVEKPEVKQNTSNNKTIKKETMKQEKTSLPPKQKKMKKSIFVSYSPDAGFIERKFIVETVRQLKENNLAEDIWFDKDEKNTDSPCWFSFRMEAVERCRSAILFLSDSYFSCPVSVYEGRALLERQKADPNSVKVFVVLYSLSEDTDVPKQYNQLMSNVVDLTGNQEKKSIAEKTSYVVGSLMEELDKFAAINAPPRPPTPPDTEFTGGFKKKKICQWSANDLQEWTFNLGIKEFYRQSLAENMVDGFLLMSMTDQDMIQQLGVDSRVVRKKLMQQILVTLDKEHKLPDNWHLRARTMRPKVNCIYLIYDPADVRLAQNLKHDLVKKNLQVIHHQKLGQSKEEFLQLNGPNMAAATYVLVLMTDAAANSPFVFHEVLFADWLGKKILTVMFKNTWAGLRASMKAVLGECPSVDFESKLYLESMDVLEHHIKPLRTVPGVVLEQAYLNKMAEGLKPLEVLASPAASSTDWSKDDKDAKVFISYQWDMQSRVEDIRRLLEANALSCWADISPTLTQRGHSSMSSRSTHSITTHSIDAAASNAETLQSQIQRTMKAAVVVLCCITPKYMQSDNCVKDLTLAEMLRKPILPLMMRFCPWPPEGTPSQVRKILARHPPVDLSNDKLFRQNVPTLLDKIKKIVSAKSGV